MNWPDERYVRVYTRDTTDWLCLSFPAQGLFCLLLRKVDRAGILPLGSKGKKGVGVAIGHAHQWAMLEPALEELLADGCVVIQGECLVVPNFIEAQEAEASDKARSRKARERARALAAAGIKPTSRNVSDRHGNPEPRDGNDTGRDAPDTICDQTVTPNQPSQPCRTDPSQASRAGPAEPTPDRLADEPEWMDDVRTKLASSLGMPKPLGIGRNPADVIRAFTRIRKGWGHDTMISEALAAAIDNRVVPANLSWWVGWFDRVPDSSLRVSVGQ
jgi:hypothetical protein